MVEFITDDYGALVEKENVEQLAEEIGNILSNKRRFDPKVLEEYVKNNFSQQSYVDKVLEIYNNARLLK